MKIWKTIASPVFTLALITAPLAASAQQPVQAPAADPDPAPAPSGVAPEGYIIGNNDVVEVSVLGRTDFNTRARVRPDGTIVLPLLGVIPAANFTSLQLGDKIQEALRKGGYFASPVVNVDVVSYTSRYVIVLGGVGKPGLVTVDRAYRLSEILARVGGVHEGGATYVILKRGDEPEKKLDVAKLSMGGTADDPYVMAGDKIFSPPPEVFYISGAIKAPGVFPIVKDMTFRMALIRAGGVSAEGSEGRLSVTRDGKKANVKITDMVMPGDIIKIGERLF